MSPSRLLAMVLAAGVAAPAIAAGNGLAVPPDALDTPRWNTRFEFDNPAPLSRLLATNWALEQAPLTGRLLGDYRFDALRFGQTGGLRLTSGVLVNLRGPGSLGLGAATTLSADTPSAAQPYAGIGYSGSGSHGDWGFSADFGLAAQNPGAAVQLGRVFNGFPSLGDTVRDLRLQPMIRLGMSYAF
jgi:hypothetical protein